MGEPGAESGYFVIADISGYTRFMAETEIEHAKGVLEGLFAALIPAIRAPLAISGMQGDAIFAYAVDGDLARGQTLLDAVERIYAEFADARERMKINTSCPCRACAMIGDLDLKIIVHHGDYVVQESGGRRELAGRDVIAAFRLLKNRVQETDGLTAYGLFTEAAVAAMGLEGFFDPAARRAETYEHIGEVRYYVHPLREAWLASRDARRVRVDPGDDLLVPPQVLTLPLSPQAAFVLLTRPELKAQWIGADGISLDGAHGGRIGAETVYHCQHGPQEMVSEVVDWRPGDYVTVEHRLPLGARAFETRVIRPVEGGVEVTTLMGRARGTAPLSRLMLPVVNRSMRRVVAELLAESAPRLQRMAEEMRAVDPGAAPDAAADPGAVGVAKAVEGRLGT